VSGFERNQAFTTRRQLLKPRVGRSRLLEKILSASGGWRFFSKPEGLGLARGWPVGFNLAEVV